MGLGLAILNLLPFGGLLVLIAVLPFIPATAAWWEKPKNKLIVCAACGFAGAALVFFQTGDFPRVGSVVLDYLDFLTFLAALYAVSGGIHIGGAFQGFPLMNTFFLLIGAFLSNLLGTTGASLLLIRPLLHGNRHRKHKIHLLLFFIFIVSNCGAFLVPLGPPLYLGYLRGVPFLWTLGLWKPWALVLGLLLVLFHLCDEWVFEGEEVKSKGRMAMEISRAAGRIRVQGWPNLGFLALAAGVILFSGYILSPILSKVWGEGGGQAVCQLFRIAAFSLITWASFRWTPRSIHSENRFHWAPLGEVAVLFFGIFGAMMPPLALMEAKASSIALTQPWQYFWASGLLSAFLDNAPTYLNFTVLAAAQKGIAAGHLGELAARFPELLAAISCGASFMGALTYIGNGPNLMVKAVAEHHHVKMPSFGAYMLWSGAILIPIFILITFIFF